MNESIFPSDPRTICEGSHTEYIVKGQIGLTKRELFAAMAMSRIRILDTGFYVTAEQCAKQAVDDADALLKELNKENDGA